MFKIFRKKKSKIPPHPTAIAFVDAIKQDPTRLSRVDWIRLKSKLYEDLSDNEIDWVNDEIKRTRLEYLNVEIARLQLLGPEEKPKDNQKISSANISMDRSVNTSMDDYIKSMGNLLNINPRS